jgi:hypothetical protein
MEEALQSVAAAVVGMAACLLPVLGAGAMVVVIIFAVRSYRRQREALVQLARQWGCEFYPNDPWNLPERYKNDFEFFKTGHDRRASCIISGTKDGLRLKVFDYKYSSGSGDSESTYYRTVAMLELPIRAPRLQLRDESVADTVAGWLGHDDIDFESAEFSRRYFVKCTERKFAYDIFHARLIEYLLACGQCPAMEMCGSLVLLSVSRQGLPERVRLVQIGEEIVRSIPEYVRHERGQAAAGGIS